MFCVEVKKERVGRKEEEGRRRRIIDDGMGKFNMA